MQDSQASELRCHYPGCTRLAQQRCVECHQTFCEQHIHRRWWRDICEFCLLLEAARQSFEKRISRIGYLLCGLLVVVGLFLLLIGQNAWGVTALVAGISGTMAVSQFWRPVRPTRASD